MWFMLKQFKMGSLPLRILWRIAMVIFLTNVLLVKLSCFDYIWWIKASPSQFMMWYERWGLVMWGIKSLVILYLFLSTLLLGVFFLQQMAAFVKSHSNIFNSIFVMTTYFLASIAFGEIHPFTMVPMYQRIRQHMELFYLEDEKGKVIPLVSVGIISSAFINKHFDTFLNAEHLNMNQVLADSAILRRAGSYVFHRSVSIDKLVESGHQSAKMVILHCTVESVDCQRIVIHEYIK